MTNVKPSVKLAFYAIANEQAHGTYFPSSAKEMAELGSQVCAEEGIRYWISPGGDSITCTTCRHTSRNMNDVANCYCAACHVFHHEKPVNLTEHHQKAHESLDWLMAAYLRYNPGKMPSTTTLMELMIWSNRQTAEATRETQ